MMYGRSALTIVGTDCKIEKKREKKKGKGQSTPACLVVFESEVTSGQHLED